MMENDTYMTCLQHTKRLTKSQMSTDIGGKEHPPVVYIRATLHSICLDLVDSQ